MILPAILHYCQYQERCHQEVRNKLYELGCKTPEVELQIAELIEKNIVNEERFARAYARGKFRMNKWGRQKIRQQLRQRKISEYCIGKAFQEIDENEYESTIRKLVEKKCKVVPTSDREIMKAKQRIYKYLIQKGFEADIIKDVINVCIN